MEENESRKVINEWMVFIDDHVTNIQDSKSRIMSDMDKLNPEQLTEVAGTLTETKGKFGEAQKILKRKIEEIEEKILGK